MTPDKITPQILRAMKKRGEVIAALTAYDCPTADHLDAAGAEVLLVGDSLGMVVLGFDSTLPVTLEHMIHHTAAVTRRKRRAMVVADMPWLTFHTGPRDTILNAQASRAIFATVEAALESCRTGRVVEVE